MADLQIHEERGIRAFPLPRRKVSIGRKPDNDVVLKDHSASRYHCTLEPVEGGWLITDLGAHNGTFVNGVRVTSRIVTPDDEIRIGTTVLRVAEEQPAEEEGLAVLEELAESELATRAEPIPMAILDEPGDVIAVEPARADAAPVGLQGLRAVGRDVGFVEKDIAMVDRQGQVIHAAGRAQEDRDAVRQFREILLVAFRTRATDMHFEPRRTDYQVRFRVDGTMLPICMLPQALGQAVLGIVKVLCEMDISRRNVVQEGSFAVRVPGRFVDFRVSFSPTNYGQKLVIRILDRAIVPAMLNDIGMPPVMLRTLRSVCQLDSGMVIVSGPTGSGKTTTLYSCLRAIDAGARNIITIEDPVEYQLDGITQTPVDARAGMTFASLLVSMLRQDPDVILVGEIRDAETAQTAMRAAMTGHLVFTTLHARDTIGSIFRLMDLGVEPFMIANAVTLCLAQRLVRVLCEECKRSYRPSPSQLVKMAMENRRIERLFTHVGCGRCMGVGFLGRTAIFEMLEFKPDIRDAIMATPTIQQIRRAADQWTFQTLLDSGYAKVVEGVTTIEEVERVATQE